MTSRRPVLACAAAVVSVFVTVSAFAPAAYAEPSSSTSVAPTTSDEETVEPTVTVPSPTDETEPSTTTTSDEPEPSTSTPSSAVVPSTSSTAPRARAGVSPLAASGLSVSTGGYGTIVPGSTSANGSLPLVTVASGGGGSWTATASSNGFGCPAMTIPSSAVTYSATAPAGGLYMNARSNQNLSSPQVVMTSTSGLAELVTWTPLLSVAYPGGAAICTFSGTITISVA